MDDFIMTYIYSVNKRLGKIFVAIRDNDLVCLDFNLMGFHEKFSKIEPGCGSYITFFRNFKKHDERRFRFEAGEKEYWFQVIELNPRKSTESESDPLDHDLS